MGVRDKIDRFKHIRRVLDEYEKAIDVAYSGNYEDEESFDEEFGYKIDYSDFHLAEALIRDMGENNAKNIAEAILAYNSHRSEYTYER